MTPPEAQGSPQVSEHVSCRSPGGQGNRRSQACPYYPGSRNEHQAQVAKAGCLSRCWRGSWCFSLLDARGTASHASKAPHAPTPQRAGRRGPQGPSRLRPRRRGVARSKSQQHQGIGLKHRNEAPAGAQTGPRWGPQGSTLGPIFRGPNYPLETSGDGEKKRPWGPTGPHRPTRGPLRPTTTPPFPGPQGPHHARRPEPTAAPLNQSSPCKNRRPPLLSPPESGNDRTR